MIDKVPTCPKCNGIVHQYLENPPLFQCLGVECLKTNCGEVLASDVVWKEMEIPDLKEIKYAQPRLTFEEINILLNTIEFYKNENIMFKNNQALKEQLRDIQIELQRSKIR